MPRCLRALPEHHACLLLQPVAAQCERAIAIGDPSGGVRRPPKRHLAVRDSDVGVVVFGLSETRDTVHERDCVAERAELERSLERTLDLVPVVHDRSIAAPVRTGGREPPLRHLAQRVRETNTTMESTRYLIVGGGMTGDAAVKGIRERDADGSIVLVGAAGDEVEQPVGARLVLVRHPDAAGVETRMPATAVELHVRVAADDRRDVEPVEEEGDPLLGRPLGEDVDVVARRGVAVEDVADRWVSGQLVEELDLLLAQLRARRLENSGGASPSSPG